MSTMTPKTGAPMSERELIDEIMTLIVAGHETTAAGLNWTWYLLSQHPEAEARLHAELDAMPEHQPLGLAANGELPFARAVVDEALRLYPPVWVFTRRALEADTLGGFAIYEMLAHLSQFARRFRLRIVPGQPVALEARVNLRPAQPLLMTLERR
jgi:cytochrome P450